MLPFLSPEQGLCFCVKSCLVVHAMEDSPWFAVVYVDHHKN